MKPNVLAFFGRDQIVHCDLQAQVNLNLYAGSGGVGIVVLHRLAQAFATLLCLRLVPILIYLWVCYGLFHVCFEPRGLAV